MEYEDHTVRHAAPLTRALVHGQNRLACGRNTFLALQRFCIAARLVQVLESNPRVNDNTGREVQVLAQVGAAVLQRGFVTHVLGGPAPALEDSFNPSAIRNLGVELQNQKRRNLDQDLPPIDENAISAHRRGNFGLVLNIVYNQ